MGVVRSVTRNITDTVEVGDEVQVPKQTSCTNISPIKRHKIISVETEMREIKHPSLTE